MVANANKYSVYVSTKDYEDGQYGFSAVEIVPPLPKSLAVKICDKVVDYCKELPGAASLKDQPVTSLTAYGFCDEGTGVSTLLKFGITPSFMGEDANSKFYVEKRLQSFVESQISPSGMVV